MIPVVTRAERTVETIEIFRESLSQVGDLNFVWRCAPRPRVVESEKVNVGFTSVAGGQ